MSPSEKLQRTLNAGPLAAAYRDQTPLLKLIALGRGKLAGKEAIPRHKAQPAGLSSYLLDTRTLR